MLLWEGNKMKFAIVLLAFLVAVFLCIPLVLTSCNNEKIDYDDITISLYIKESNEIKKVKLEEYLVNVVSSEMPSSFSKEALKAQAVAARTYALKKINKELPEHKKADLCSDYSHCQAYSDNSKLKSKWGKSYSSNIEKIKAAVNETKGEYLSYNGDYAITVFHSCSNGITEKASEVWGGDIAYLTNVKSPGDYMKKDYVTKATFNRDEFIDIIEKHLKNTIDDTQKPVGDISYTSGSNIKDICIFGQKIKGVDMRKIFSLKSSSFSLEEKDGEFIFTVTGNGHGVGMSQYGAEKMACDKFNYKDILSHYYPGTCLENVNNQR